MIENTNTKQFYPGPILNNTLEITDFLFNDAEQIKIKYSKLNEEGVLIDIDLDYPIDYEVTKILPSDIDATEAALTASTGQVLLKNVNVLAGEKLTVYRVSQIIQNMDYPRAGAFPAASHEGALDYLTMQNQEQQEQIDRSLKIPNSVETFDAQIRHERFVEFFAEGRRYYDLRRWGTLEAEESEPITGMNVESVANGYFARTVVNHADFRNRVCDKKMVFLPIHRDELRKSRLLDQNPGW